MVPSNEDVEAGYTEVLTAVAVYHPEQPPMEVPWAHAGDVGIWPAEVNSMLREITGWERSSIAYVVYFVPENEYRPLGEMGIGGPVELGLTDFVATPDEVERVRSAMQGRETTQETDRDNPS